MKSLVRSRRGSKASATLLQGRLVVGTDSEEFLNEKRVCLLEAIAETGSLSAAVRCVPMSYKTAWDALAKMQYLARTPLVTTVVGGTQGGGTVLTDYGRYLVTRYRFMEKTWQLIVLEGWHEME